MISSFIPEYFNSSLEVAGSWFPLHIPQNDWSLCDPLDISPKKTGWSTNLRGKEKERQWIFLHGNLKTFLGMMNHHDPLMIPY